MVNVRFSNFNDFFKALRSSTPDVQKILMKAYPDYTQQLVNMYRTTTSQPSLTTSKVQPKSITGAAQKAIGTTAKTTSNTSKAAGVLSKTKGLGKVVGKLAVPLAIAGEIPNLIDKNNPVQNKILSGIGIGGLLTGNIPVAAAGFLGAGLNKYGADAINKLADKNAQDFEAKYGDRLTPNAHLQAPQLRTLTPEQQDKVFNYQRGQINDLFNRYDESIDNLNKEQAARDEAAARAAKAEEDLRSQQKIYSDILLNSGIPQGNLQPNQTQPQGNLLSSTPINVQNGQGGVLNNQQVQVIGDDNQGALTSLVGPSNLANLYRVGANTNFQGLQDMVMNNNYNNQQPVRSDALNYYAQILGAQNAQAQLAAQQTNDAYKQLIADYANAQRLDNLQNYTNQIQNVMNNLSYERPIQYVGVDGGLKTVGGYNPPYTNLPTDTTNNTAAFVRQLALQQARDKAVKAATPNTAADMSKILGAEAVARTIGVDPIALLDYGDKLIPYQQAIASARTAGEERRKDIPYNTLANMIENQNKVAGDIDLAQVKANLGLQQEQFTQNELNKRAYAELMQNAVLAQKRIDSQLDLLRERGAQERELAQYKLQLENEDPSLKALKGMQYSANYPDPTQALNTYQQFLELFGGATQKDKGGAPVQGGNITPIGYQRMMRRN